VILARPGVFVSVDRRPFIDNAWSDR